MSYPTVVQILRDFEVKLAREHGPFTLFALVERPEFPGMWDLVVAAPWFSSSDRETLDVLVQELKRGPGNDVLLALSQIAILRPTEPLVRAINDAVGHVEHGEVKLETTSLGLEGRDAIIITSQSVPRAA
ncbi:MAG TPA: hypothetical protein VNV25_22255 [Gemmatimonadaceae bacterium]|jgi:hypothetical protein|nr:hypothetical protein [Gemmatimonadaceae bacterium]